MHTAARQATPLLLPQVLLLPLLLSWCCPNLLAALSSYHPVLSTSISQSLSINVQVWQAGALPADLILVPLLQALHLAGILQLQEARQARQQALKQNKASTCRRVCSVSRNRLPC